MNGISYQSLAWIAGVASAINVILIVLIANRKIGRPLTESELEERRVAKAQKMAKREQRRAAWEEEERKEDKRLQAQEEKILSLTTPVTFVSLKGTDPLGETTICVQDGMKRTHVFHCPTYLLKSNHAFNSLCDAAEGPAYHNKIGAELFI